MGKRSEFAKLTKDQYMTIDPIASKVLDQHLVNRLRFYEPCVGEGHLVKQLENFGHTCIGYSDIDPKFTEIIKDASTIKITHDIDAIITNPPWSRKILHSIIENLSIQAPTWLLFDADWAHTKQSSLYIRELCTDIISVGRMKWIPNTNMTGKDNCAWYRFHSQKSEKTRFFGR